MSIQYVEIDAAPTHRHIVKSILKGKSLKTGSKQALTLCGKPFEVDASIIFSQPTSTVGEDKSRPPCSACNGMEEEKPAAAPTALRLEQLDVDEIERSPLNHRTRFEGIAELGADIKANGLRVPIKVRPSGLVGSGNVPHRIKWQLVYGERRWRAAKAAGVKSLPALIAELDDLAVIKEQLVENVSRSDVHPIEEADGYQQLLEQHGYSVERIATETGKSRTAIYNRLKLRELPAAAREACFSGKLSTSIAELIARIPVAKLREEATRDIIRGREQDRWELDQTLDEITQQVAEDLVDEDADDYIERNQPREGLAIEPEHVPLSTREASVLIKRRYMLRLELAPFDTKDETLTDAGACTKCVHRTGNQPDLFGDVASADVCTNPPCFEEKRARSTEAKIQATKAAGLEVLAGKKAEQIFQHDGSLTYSAPYVDLDDEASWQYQEEKGERGERTEKTWRQLLAGDAPSPVVALDPRGKAHELVDKKAAIAALKESDRLPKSAERELERGRSESSSREKAEREKHALKVATATRAIAMIVEDGPGIGSIEIARWLAECVIRQASMEAHALVIKRRALEVNDKGPANGRGRNETALMKLAKNLKTHALLEGLVIELLASEAAAARYSTGYGPNLEAAAKPFGIDLAKIKKTVEAEVKAAKKTASTAAKKTPSKKKGRKS